MEAYVGDWLNLLIRWVHLITGIAWIGASFYFVWLDNRLLPPKRGQDADEGVGGELWAIHGGGFYHVQKFRVAPKVLPAPLHWFKWEAYSTWLSGFVLFAVMYYANARTYMIDPAVADLARWQAVAISIVMLVLGWLFYDQLCKRLGFDHERWPERLDAKGAPPFAQVERIVVERCATCHSEKLTQPGFAVAPKGLMLDTPERIVAGGRQIYEQSVATKVMPIGNLTGMSDAERQQLGAWISAGMPR